MVFRVFLVAMLFAVPVLAQEQEQAMMDRIMNPNRDRANPMGEKAFKGTPFAAREYGGPREYGGVKSASTKEFSTRKFFGIRNPWFGKRVYETRAGRELTRYVLSDKAYASRGVEAKPAREGGKRAAAVDGAVDTRDFLARGKSQNSLNDTHSSGPALSLEEVRELLNRNR